MFLLSTFITKLQLQLGTFNTVPRKPMREITRLIRWQRLIMLDIMTREFGRGSRGPNFGGAYGQVENKGCYGFLLYTWLTFSAERIVPKACRR